MYPNHKVHPDRTPYPDQKVHPDLSMDVVAEYRPAVLALAARLLRRRKDDPDVEDVAHETFRRVLEQPEKWDADRPLLPWVLGIARHVALDALRTSARQRARLSTPQAGANGGDPVLGLLSPEPGPDSAYTTRESARRLERAIDALPAGERGALLLFHLDGLSYREIAERLGVPPATVGTWVLRARRAVTAAVARSSNNESRGES